MPSIPQHSDKLVENRSYKLEYTQVFYLYQNSEAQRFIFTFTPIILSVTSESETKPWKNVRVEVR